MKHMFKHILAWFLTLILFVCPALAAFSFLDMDENAGHANVEGRDVPTVGRGDVVAYKRTKITISTQSIPDDTKTSTFPDVDVNATYAEAVEYLNDNGIMQGDNLGNFNPDKPVTRAEMAAITCRMLGEADIPACMTYYDDVPQFHWASGYINRADFWGIIDGYDAFTFGPSDAVTCEQASTIMVRAVLGDAKAIAAGGYPNGYWSVAQEYGLLDGVYAQKTEGMTRANIAVMIYNWVRAVWAGKLPADPTALEVGNVKAGTYQLDEGAMEPHTLYIYRLNSDGTMMFGVNWYRGAFLSGVKAILDGNRATFNYSTASGYIDFSKDGTAILTITSSNSNYLPGCSVFQFITPEELKAEKEARTMSILCWNTDTKGWIGMKRTDPDDPDIYTEQYLRFYENGTVDIWTSEIMWGEGDVVNRTAQFYLDHNNIFIDIDGYKYEGVLGHEATEHLYLTALGGDPYELDGSYDFKADDMYESIYTLA